MRSRISEHPKTGTRKKAALRMKLWRYLMDIFEKVKDLIADQLDVDDKESITNDSSITDDLGADSLDVVDLVMALEDEFGVEIPEDQVENIKTVGDIVKYIEDKQ